MNPLGLRPDNFLVAEPLSGGAPLAFVQMEDKGALEGVSSTGGRYQELRTLIVDPNARGKGIGSALVEELLTGVKAGDEVWCTTVSRNMDFYFRLGFEQMAVDEELPSFLKIEAALGVFVARFLANEELVV
eukprot:gene3155-13168_t